MIFIVGEMEFLSTSSSESSFRELDDEFLQRQARIWLGEMLHVRFDEKTSVTDLLADGELLCQVSKVVWQMLLRTNPELSDSKAYISEPTASGKSGGRYLPYLNVDAFLKICQILGLTSVDLFTPSDVVERRGTRRVCICVRSLSKKARSRQLNVPDFDVVTSTIAMPTDMVGCIRRCLEQSQCSSSVSLSHTSSSERNPKKKSSRGELIRLFGHPSEFSSDAESSLRNLDFGSTASSTSYETFSRSTHFSPRCGSVVEDNFSTTPLQIQSPLENTCNGGHLDFEIDSHYSSAVKNSVNAGVIDKGDYPSRVLDNQHTVTSTDAYIREICSSSVLDNEMIFTIFPDSVDSRSDILSSYVQEELGNTHVFTTPGAYHATSKKIVESGCNYCMEGSPSANSIFWAGKNMEVLGECICQIHVKSPNNKSELISEFRDLNCPYALENIGSYKSHLYGHVLGHLDSLYSCTLACNCNHNSELATYTKYMLPQGVFPVSHLDSNFVQNCKEYVVGVDCGLSSEPQGSDVKYLGRTACPRLKCPSDVAKTHFQEAESDAADFGAAVIEVEQSAKLNFNGNKKELQLRSKSSDRSVLHVRDQWLASENRVHDKVEAFSIVGMEDSTCQPSKHCEEDPIEFGAKNFSDRCLDGCCKNMWVDKHINSNGKSGETDLKIVKFSDHHISMERAAGALITEIDAFSTTACFSDQATENVKLNDENERRPYGSHQETNQQEAGIGPLSNSNGMHGNSDGELPKKGSRKKRLASVFGGVAIFGAFLLLLQIRKPRVHDEERDRKFVGKSKASWPSFWKRGSESDKAETDKAGRVYPGERLKLLD
ncbi:uncharacterized protein LOC18995746 isoform X1 [Amborella trichopoda]|nr:uncharacterized protein LOC18995746 isoform X1 [Amborella trichopoda]|eukprot:XP_020524294.1 uncharacterized protein LOC18995746 isoform X1 [Amborella trichopoda]